MDALPNWEYWLDEFLENHDNETWLERYDHYVDDTLLIALGVPRRALDGITGVLSIYKRRLEQGHYKKLQLMLQRALLVAQNLNDSAMQSELWHMLGDMQVRQGLARSAALALEHARVRAADRVDEAEDRMNLLKIYMAIIRLQLYRRDPAFRPRHIGTAIKLARELKSPDVLPELYQALVYVYCSRGEIRRAEYYARRALKLWEKQGNTTEMAHTAYVLGSACRHQAHDLKKARHYLDMAGDLYARTNARSQYFLITYEQGTLLLEKKEYAEALLWLDDTLREYHLLGQEREIHLAILQHARGTALMYMGRYDEALELFDTAEAIWQKHGDEYSLAKLCNDRGYIALLQKQYAAARDYLHQALQTCEKLEQAADVTTLQEIIQGNLKDLDAASP